MSELTTCNYCSFREIKARCKKEKKKCKLVSSKDLAGFTAAEVDDIEVAWFKEMTDHCVCNL